MQKHKSRIRISLDADIQRLLLPLSNIEEAEILLPLAQALARSRQANLVVMNFVIVSDLDRLSEEAINVSRSRQELNQYLIDHGYDIPEIQTIVRVTTEIWEGIWEAVEQENIDLLILGWQSEGMQDTVIADVFDRRLLSPPCDVILVHPERDFSASDGWQKYRRYLVPVRGGPEATLALRTAKALAELNPAAQITLLHISQDAPRETEVRAVNELSKTLHEVPQINRTITMVGNVLESILEEAANHDVVVMGAPEPFDRQTWRNEFINRIEKEMDASLILVKEHALRTDEALAGIRIKQRNRDRPIAFVVDRWFAENTFHSREFANLEAMLNLKESQGIRISLGLPALNEAETVGNVIGAVKEHLMDRFPLLDEIVLIDSGSTDYTREIAEDLGIPVYVHQEILPQYGTFHGKGEALWKSLFVLNGDIIAWIDTDIRNIHPRFVYGILGPLLRTPRIQYVKGFYRRPLRQGDKIVAGGGGRVTELTARPLINLFYPELSGIIQPLSGEYAGRRTVLEKLAFFTGYGVETGLLLDILDQYGLQAIAQSDLLERVHHNQPLPSLSKMSFTIIQVFMKRLERRFNLQLLEDSNRTMNLPRYSPRRFYLETEELIEHERPPMITLPEYREKFGLNQRVKQHTNEADDRETEVL
jgi:glucosyl-3-phosphoglycerate synthase